jgi:hypothetical protein
MTSIQVVLNIDVDEKDESLWDSQPKGTSVVKVVSNELGSWIESLDYVKGYVLEVNDDEDEG